jgi:predicted  nucleic acid-binding Zn-ribbon protein
VTVRTTEYRDHLYRYECEECGRWFTDTSGTFIENANVGLPVWIYVIREMDKDRSINSIAEDLPHTYKTVHRLSKVIREAIYERREEWLGPLTGEVEADDVHLKGGQQGRELASEESEAEGSEATAWGREARERGLSERGRGSWEGDRPPAVLWVEREGEGGGARVIELRGTSSQRAGSTPTTLADIASWAKPTTIGASTTRRPTSPMTKCTATPPRRSGLCSSRGGTDSVE